MDISSSLKEEFFSDDVDLDGFLYDEEKMPKHSLRQIDDILGDLRPKKTGKAYDKTWREFIPYTTESPPTENDYLAYFDMLHKQKGKLDSVEHVLAPKL